MKKCALCNQNKKSMKGNRCYSCVTKLRRHRFKVAAVKYLGGKCTRCGYDENVIGLDFHHTDPTKKEFSVGKMSNKSWKTIKPELDKCVLLCAICHRLEHAERDAIFLLEAEKHELDFGT